MEGNKLVRHQPWHFLTNRNRGKAAWDGIDKKQAGHSTSGDERETRQRR